jgi:fatty-acyl-CoA synthase
MAAITAGAGFDLVALADSLAKNLPPYARPVFLRLQPEMEITGTFKLRKVELVKEGFDPRALNEPLYMLDASTGRYVPLDAPLYEKVVTGQVKL